MSNLGERHVHIPKEIVYRYERLLQGGIWCRLELVYSADEEAAQKRPFFIEGLRPIQAATISMADYVAGRTHFSGDDTAARHGCGRRMPLPLACGAPIRRPAHRLLDAAPLPHIMRTEQRTPPLDRGGGSLGE